MRGIVALILTLTAALSAGPALSAESFLAPAVTQGSLEVTLIPSASVAAGASAVVSFGVPFPRGSISEEGLSSLKVSANGIEIPAFVSQLTPWRHRRSPALNGASVRIALVQVERPFATVGAPIAVSVSWGGAPRTLNRPQRLTRAETWSPVNDGGFTVADNVFEPRVYAVLPRDWLVRGTLRANQTLPFDASNQNVRDDPAAMDAILTWPGFTEADRAFKNNFYTVVNRDDPAVTVANQCPFKTAFEPWLYDRAATMFSLYLRSGSFSALREAVRNAEFYRARVTANGEFSLKPGDNKYAFNESLAYAFWLTGDATFLPEINRTADAHNASPHAWTAALGFWTERMVAFKLMAHLIAWEVDGAASRSSSIDAIVAALGVHQNGANGAIPASGRVDGGFYHLGSQHDGDWDAAAFGGSTWMTALLSDALRRAYPSDETQALADTIRRSGAFFRQSLRTESGQYGVSTRAPRYVVEYDGSDFAQASPLHDEEHALDVSAALAWADYFGALNGPRDPLLAPAIAQVYLTYDLSVNFWIRPAGPLSGLAAFRVNPWRKWGWEHRTSDGLSWAMLASSVESPLFANGFEVLSSKRTVLK